MPEYRQGRCIARLLLTANVSLPAGANDIPWQVADFDDVGGWNGGAGYVIQRSGLYMWAVAANRAAVGTASQMVVRARLDGLGHQQVTTAPATQAMQTQVSTMDFLEVGQVVSGNVTLHTTAAATLTAGNTSFYLVRLGPKRWT